MMHSAAGLQSPSGSGKTHKYQERLGFPEFYFLQIVFDKIIIKIQSITVMTKNTVEKNAGSTERPDHECGQNTVL